MIFWAGKSSDDVHVVVERYPSMPLAARKLDVQSVPGRSGDLIFPQDAYENYVQQYEVYISAERIRLPRAMREVAQWLCAPKGYQRLEDSYDLETFRNAYFVGPLDVESIMHRFGRATIEFSCQPQRWLRSGEIESRLSNGQSLLNPTAFTAKPLITVTGSGSGTLTVGDRTVEINSFPDGYVVLDCEAQNAYGAQGANRNATILAPEFPELAAGETPVSWSGGIAAVTIKPRWWTL